MDRRNGLVGPLMMNPRPEAGRFGFGALPSISPPLGGPKLQGLPIQAPPIGGPRLAAIQVIQRVRCPKCGSLKVRCTKTDGNIRYYRCGSETGSSKSNRIPAIAWTGGCLDEDGEVFRFKVRLV